MLCAQALAPLRPGDAVDVRWNAEDVKCDLLVWAQDRGHAALVTGPEALRMRKG